MKSVAGLTFTSRNSEDHRVLRSAGLRLSQARAGSGGDQPELVLARLLIDCIIHPSNSVLPILSISNHHQHFYQWSKK